MAEAQLDESNPVELQLKFDIRLAGQDFVGGGHFPSYEKTNYIHRCYHISVPSLSDIAKKDFTGGKPEIDPNDNFYTGYQTPVFNLGHSNLPLMKIPVLAKGLNWSVKDSNSGSPLVANTKDSFITVPSLEVLIDYDTTKYKFDVTRVDLNRVPPLIDYTYSTLPPEEPIVVVSGDPKKTAELQEEAHKEYEEKLKEWKKNGKITVYKPSEEIYDGYNFNTLGVNSSKGTATITFIGSQDNKNQFHGVKPVVWVRVDDSYAKAHPEGLRKQGYFYYKQDTISWNVQSWYDPLASIYSVDDVEYKFNMDDLKDFKNAIDKFVNEYYGGYDVPLNVPLSFKWPSSEHDGENFALNIYVHAKGVL